MHGLLSPQSLGAMVIGCAVVFAAYTANSLRTPRTTEFIAATTTVPPAPLRSAIAVTDSDNNGLEDWRDAFVVAEPVILSASETASDYVPPDTITGNVAINLTEGFLRARYLGPVARRDQEEVIEDVVNSATRATAISIYDTPDIFITTDSPENIRQYGNAVANALIDNNVSGLENELFIFQDIVRKQQTERLSELKTLATMYASMRDTLLAQPVPAPMVKEHLDLINTFNALYHDIDAMSLYNEDPIVPLLHLKRYEDDVLGMKLALENIYRVLLPHAGVFSEDDPAVILVNFSPNFQAQALPRNN